MRGQVKLFLVDFRLSCRQDMAQPSPQPSLSGNGHDSGEEGDPPSFVCPVQGEHCPCCPRLSNAYRFLRGSYNQLYGWCEDIANHSEQIRTVAQDTANRQVDNEQLISQLRASHSALMMQMSDLCRTVEVNSQLAVSLTTRTRFSQHVARKVLANTSLNFSAMLSTPSTALNRRLVDPTEFTTVSSDQNRSDPTDCSLLELQAVLDALRSHGQVVSRCTPSAYEIDFADSTSVQRLSIHFRNFSAMCDALDIPFQARIKGLYRDRRTRDQIVRVIQIAGAAVFYPPSSSCKILLGCSDLCSTTNATVLALDTPTWHRIDWNRGFVLKNMTSDSSEYRQLRTEIQTSVPDTQGFQLVWERKKPHPSVATPSYTPDAVLGRLEAHIPLVIIRSNKLIATARIALGTPDSPTPALSTLCSSSCRGRFL